MRVRLADQWVEELLQKTESGMGFQRVTVLFADGRRAEDVVVFNADEIELPEELATVPIVQINVRR